MTSEKRAQKLHTVEASLPRSDWSCCLGNLIQPIRSTTQIWVVMRHQYGISVLVSQRSFVGETSGSIAKCLLFSQPSFIFTVLSLESECVEIFFIVEHFCHYDIFHADCCQGRCQDGFTENSNNAEDGPSGESTGTPANEDQGDTVPVTSVNGETAEMVRVYNFNLSSFCLC